MSTNRSLPALSLYGTDRRMKALADLPDSPAECEALYREHGARVLRLARLLLDDRQEAQDVAQEVFLKLLRAYPAVDRPMRWGPWLTKVTVNACRDRRRSGWWRWWRGLHEPIEDVAVVDVAPSPERAALDAVGRERIARVFRQLPARQREAVALRYVEGWSTREIADELGVTTGSVKRHLFRAVQRLRAALGDGT
jgi:RNA polymerase sigma-70 factor (ECF subfamily)